jgi:DNA-binding protein HU-beta
MSAFAFIENLQQFPGWPSHESKGILRLNEPIQTVKARLHAATVETQKGDESDGLGPYESLLLKDEDIGFVALVTHTRAPHKGTDVIVDSGISTESAIRRIADVLKLSEEDVAWIHPEATQLARDFGHSELKTRPKSRGAPATMVPLSKVAAELAEKTGMTRKGATETVGDFVGLVVKHLKKGNKVRINGLGILQVRDRPARMGRNPATGEQITIKASKKVFFRAAKDLK